jgi:hypothetical protein
MTTFQEAVAFLEEKNVEFTQGYEYRGKHGEGDGRNHHDLPLIEQIKPPFTAEEWLDLVSSDSELLGSCCAQISNARDVLFGKVRHGCWMRSGEVWEFFARLANHDGFDYMLPVDGERYEKWDGGHYFESEDHDAVYRFWKVFDKIKDHLPMKAPETKPYSEDAPIRDPIQMAFRVARAGIDDLDWATGCFGRNRDDDPQWLLDQRRARRQLTIARVAPAIRSILDHIHTIDLGDFEGYAVCKKDEPDEVCTNGAGRCIYTTEADAKDIIERWSKDRDERDPDEVPSHRADPRETTLIRRVSVSSETGLRFLDE